MMAGNVTIIVNPLFFLPKKKENLKSVLYLYCTILIIWITTIGKG